MISKQVTMYIGIDVGTGSVRAGLFDANGKCIQVAKHAISIFNTEPNFYEQSSDEVWNACCVTVKELVAEHDPSLVRGIGFDATCSLVVLDANFQPITISPTGDDSHNIIMWLDHRARLQAEQINSFGHEVLKNVGGKISLEMQTPKLLWLKERMPHTWERTKHCFDLPDFLTWKATGSKSRSLCSLVCKWTYQAEESGSQAWDSSFFKQIGLEDVLSNEGPSIGTEVFEPGQPVGNGLSESAAKELGLLTGTPVAASIIDAHAGTIGMLGCKAEGLNNNITSKLAMVCGTSACHLAVTNKKILVKGVWGPYWGAVPGFWLAEGGQSASGKLIDHVIETHPAWPAIQQKLPPHGHVTTYLESILKRMAQENNVADATLLSKDLHVWPDFHGNRSPVADPTLKGMVTGLTLDVSEEELARLYLATTQSLAYGSRHIISTLNEAGYTVSALLLGGGLRHSNLWLTTHADALNMPVIVPEEQESVLLGSSILASVAAKSFASVKDAMLAMGGTGTVILPRKEFKRYHDCKYKVFLKMLKNQQEYRKFMEES